MRAGWTVGTESPGTNSPKCLQKACFLTKCYTGSPNIHHVLRDASKPWWDTKWKGFSENTWDQTHLVVLLEILVHICSVAKRVANTMKWVIFYLLGINNAKAEKEWISPFSISVTAYKVRAAFLQCQPWTVKFFLHRLLTFPLQIPFGFCACCYHVPLSCCSFSSPPMIHCIPLKDEGNFQMQVHKSAHCFGNLLHHRNIQYHCHH